VTHREQMQVLEKSIALSDAMIGVIDECNRLRSLIEYIGRCGVGGNEIWPVGPSGAEYSEDENTIVRYIGPWVFLNGVGETFIEAVEDSMKKNETAEKTA
jgi:hypothetical protein